MTGGKKCFDEGECVIINLEKQTKTPLSVLCSQSLVNVVNPLTGSERLGCWTPQKMTV